jgi:hypothetical protein
VFNKELEERNEVLFAKLVPGSGAAPTLEGETLRAINRIAYRWMNDGDYWFEGYGCETAGPAHTFLYDHSPPALRAVLRPLLIDSDGKHNDEYTQAVEAMVLKCVEYIEKQTTLTPNTLDMLQCESMYEDENDWDDDEE